MYGAEEEDEVCGRGDLKVARMADGLALKRERDGVAALKIVKT